MSGILASFSRLILVALLVIAPASLRADQPKLRVVMSAPVNGALYTAPGSITLSATIARLEDDDRGEARGREREEDARAGVRRPDNPRRDDDQDERERRIDRESDRGGNPHERVVRVDFYQGVRLIGSASTAPYSYTWSNVPAGTYALSARAINAKGESVSSSRVMVTVNAPPTVALSSPSTGARYNAPASVTLAAEAADADGSVVQVQFFQEATLVGTATAAPFTISLPPLWAGTYSFTARATDNRGALATSAPVTVYVNAPPTVSLGASGGINAPATVTLTANASDADGSVARVELYQGTTLLATLTAAPFAFTLNNLGPGTYTYSAQAIDNSGAVSIVSPVVVRINAPPTVSIAAPSNGAALVPGIPVQITALATDLDGAIGKVDFFVNGMAVGSAMSAPYGVSWTPATAGSYTLTASATDNTGAVSTSAPVIVRGNAAPQIALSTAAGTVNAPGTVTLTANAQDSDGAVARVEFYQGGALVATTLAAPYTVTVRGLDAGGYVFTAVAYDNDGSRTTSSEVSVRVNSPPTIALTAPLNNGVFAPRSNVTLTATASDMDGTIAKVEFMVNGVAIGATTAAPYSIGWTPTSSGVYTLMALATDNDGSTTSSWPVAIRINALPQITLITPNANAVVNAPGAFTLSASASDADGGIVKVEFFANGSLVGTANQAPYVVSWTNAPVGTLSFTAVATDSDGGTTTSVAVPVRVNGAPVVSLTSPSGGTVIPARSTLLFTATASDADGTVAKVDFFANGLLVGTATVAPYTFTWSLPVSGVYSLTAVATDNDGASMTSAGVSVRVNALPQVAITAPTANSVVNAPGSFAIAANASDADGTIVKVEFFANGALIGGGTQAPFGVPWSNVPAGSYTITAVATDSDGGTTTSSAVALWVNGYPSVTLTAPTANALFKPAATIMLTATAQDMDGNVSRVEFYSGTTLLATVTAAPYSFAWTGFASGFHTLTARAVDDAGAGTVSAPVTITVANPEAQVYYIHTDHLNTPRAITNQNRELVWMWANDDPFGANPANDDPRNTGTSFTCNLRFPGQYFDRETGLHYNYFRDYDAGIGRYVESDPTGLQGGINTYAYVGGSPLKFSDPMGLVTYVCSRPLKWSTPLGVVGINFWRLYHQYICTVSDLNGQVVCGSITTSGPIFGSPATPTGPSNNDIYDPTRCRIAAPPNSCLESCIVGKLQGELPVYDVRAGTRFSTPGAQQCQTFTNSVLVSCQSECGLR